MVWVGRDLREHLVPALWHKQGHLALDQVAQRPIQPVIQYFQGLDMTSSGNLFQGPAHRKNPVLPLEAGLWMDF